jgi:N-terminal acetyltransferase B complex non-catalytic subunit
LATLPRWSHIRYAILQGKANGAGQNLPHTDIQPADEIGLATVQLILSTQNPTAPLRAILALEYILSKSPSCAHAKFLLIRLYRSIGAISLVKPVLEDLKLSEVQLDTLLHIWIEGAATDAILAPIPRGQELSAWENCTAAMEKMYNRSATDVRLPSLFLFPGS